MALEMAAKIICSKGSRRLKLFICLTVSLEQLLGLSVDMEVNKWSFRSLS